tara:strand:- start:15334 stop:18573 length:3240 start_codon:yes stop_codon:yes gene_type:complete
MVKKQNSIIQHYEFESFMRKISLSNFTETLLENKEILIDNDLSRDGLFEDVRDKYFRSIISTDVARESFFEDLNTNIFYHNKNYDVDKKTKIDKVFDIDMSFYASDTVKEYMFYFDFLAEYYRNLAELKNEKHMLKNEIFNHEFNIKVRIIPIGKIKNYTSVSIKKDYTTENKNYINVKFKLNEVNQDLDLTNIDPGAIFKTIQIEKDLDGTYVDSIRWLFNKLTITNELSIVNRPDYNHLFALSYKYRFYRLLLDYYVLIIYYIFIRYKREVIAEETDYNTGGGIKYAEIKEVTDNFKTVFENYRIKLIKLIRIMESVKKDDRIQESERIAESIKYKDELININKQIDLRNTTLKRYKTELKNGNNHVNNSKTVFYVSLVCFVVSLIIYLSLINNTNINVSRTVSPILLMFIIIIISVIKYIKRYRYSETFEIETSNTEELKSIDDRLKDLQDNRFSEADTQTVIQDLIKRRDEITAKNVLEYDNTWEETGAEMVIDKTGGEYKVDAVKDWTDEAAKRREDRTQYMRDLTTYEDIDFARSNHIKKLETQLRDLNDAYREAVGNERELIQRRTVIKQEITTVSDRLEQTEAAITSRFKTIARMDELLDEYQNVTDQLGGIVAKKSQIRELKIAKASQLSSENNLLAKKIRDKYQEIADTQQKFDEMSDRLKSVILRIEELDESIKIIEAEDLQEQARTISEHAQIITAIAEYREVEAKAVAAAAKIANLKSMIENEDLEIQKWSNEIVRLESETRAKAENAKLMAQKATYEAREVLKIIEEKIRKINEEVKNRPKPIIVKMDLNLNYSLVGEGNSREALDKRDTFKNIILMELSTALLVPSNRFEILDNIEKGSIIISIKIYPSRSYDSRQLTHEQLADKIIEQSKSTENTPIKLSKHLRYVQKVGKVQIDGVLTKEHVVEKPLDYNYETMGYIMKENSNEIDNIIRDILMIEGLHNNNKTYYDEVNPHFKLEVKKFRDINNDTDIKENILKSNYNISKHSINYNDNITWLIINITLLISIIFVLQSYFDNNIGFINLIGIIVFALIIAVYFINIMKPVRTKVKNQYWGTPTSQLKRVD